MGNTEIASSEYCLRNPPPCNDNQNAYCHCEEQSDEVISCNFTALLRVQRRNLSQVCLRLLCHVLSYKSTFLAVTAHVLFKRQYVFLDKVVQWKNNYFEEVVMIDRYLTRIAQTLSLSTKALLLAVDVFVVTLTIVFWQVGVLPVTQVRVFGFFAALLFFFALYRPRWAFWFFVGMLPLDVINIAPEVLGIHVRLYQLVGAALIGAIAVRAVSGRAVRRMFRWRWWDSAAMVFAASAMVAATFAVHPRSALLQAAIVSSFVAWYFLARYFVRGPLTARMPLAFFLGSGGVVTVYGIWQSWRFVRSGVAAVMTARPNATFAEPDWFGIFLVFASALLYAVLYAMRVRYGAVMTLYNKRQWALYGALWSGLLLVYSALIVTVARSAWVGAFAVATISLVFFLMRRDWRGLLWHGVGVIVVAVGALGVVAVFSLTTFDIGDRAHSAGNGMQTITVACQDTDSAVALAQRGQIDNVGQLAIFGCRHIMLEEIVQRRAEGMVIVQTVRPDPSHGVRRAIYIKTLTFLAQRSWRENVFGSGWGQVDFGHDASGARLNTSNIFLEVFVGGGILGLGAFVALLSSILWRGVRGVTVVCAQNSVRIYAYFAVLGMVALLIPNLFNAGILLGFVWVFLGMMAGVRRA